MPAAQKTHTTPDAARARLQSLLKAATAEKLKECLLATVPDAPAPQIEALLALVGPLAAAAATKLHCVRCHEGFFQHANHDGACLTLHDGRADGDRTEVGNDAITVQEACCGIEYDSEDGPDSEYCIVAAHTTNPWAVEYYDEEADGGERRNQLVVTCAEQGCTKKRKGVSGRDASTGKKKRC